MLIKATSLQLYFMGRIYLSQHDDEGERDKKKFIVERISKKFPGQQILTTHN